MAMQLDNVTQILERLGITGNDLDEVLAYAKTNKIFSAQAAVQMQKTTVDIYAEQLRQQAIDISTAAVGDFNDIKTHSRSLEAGPRSKANWGNNGPNALDALTPSIPKGASAAANLLRNVVMTVNAHPELAKDRHIQEAVNNLSHLTRQIAGEEKIKSTSILWSMSARDLWDRSVHLLKHDTKFTQALAEEGVNLDAYLAPRAQEVHDGISGQLDMGSETPTRMFARPQRPGRGRG